MSKASDISDDAVYAVVASSVFNGRPSAATVWNVERALQDFPPRVVMAKIRQMIAKGRLRGCPCGCRGDLRFPWEEFGGAYSGRRQWRERLAEYLKGPRVYGY